MKAEALPAVEPLHRCPVPCLFPRP
jgi:hypothetical protein